MTEKFMIGHTKIRLDDEFCAGKTAQEIDKTLEAVVRTARRHLLAAERSGLHENLGDSAAREGER